MTDKITIERETLEKVMSYASCDCESSFRPHFDAVMKQARAALAAQPAEPVAMLYDDGTWIAEKTATGRALSNRMLFAGSPKIGVYAAQPAPAAVPPCKIAELRAQQQEG